MWGDPFSVIFAHTHFYRFPGQETKRTGDLRFQVKEKN